MSPRLLPGRSRDTTTVDFEGAVRAGDEQEVFTDDTDIVSALRTALAERIGPDRLELWFGKATRMEISDGTLIVTAPDAFLRKWIETNFRGQIRDAARATLGKTPKLAFEVDSTPPAAADEPLPATKANGTASCAALKVVNGEVAPPSPETPGENTWRSSRRRFANIESFVKGDSNEVALGAAKAVARRPGQYSPLVIHGPTGVGKTHLLEGIWSAVRKNHRNITAIYLSAEQFTTQFLEALRGSGLPSFRRKYRGVGVLLIDDLQFLVGKRATQVELTHTVDTLLRQGRQMVFTADRAPAGLTDFAPELIARLGGGTAFAIDPPDFATRLGILARMARQLRVSVSDDVRQLIASRLTSHARELSGALCRLQATSEALARPINTAMAEDVLAEMARHCGRGVCLGDIERAVCDVFGVEAGSLHSGEKAQRVSHPRMLAMWLARKHTRAALSEIGHFFGHRTHSTVASAQKRVDGWMVAGRTLRIADGTGAVDEAIRRVERRLRAG